MAADELPELCPQHCVTHRESSEIDFSHNRVFYGCSVRLIMSHEESTLIILSRSQSCTTFLCVHHAFLVASACLGSRLRREGCLPHPIRHPARGRSSHRACDPALRAPGPPGPPHSLNHPAAGSLFPQLSPGRAAPNSACWRSAASSLVACSISRRMPA